MATWISKPWIEQALMSRSEQNLPKLARAQILKFEETSSKNIALISDKKLYVKAVFSQVALEEFRRDNPGLSMAEIQGGLIFIKKYSLQSTVENELDGAEFLLKIDQFKFAGGEGNTQFGTNVTDSSTYPPLQPRLQELWRLSQVRVLLHGQQLQTGGSIPDFKETERTLLENHENAFISENSEKKLAEIPEWKPSYCPPPSSDMQSEISSFNNRASIGEVQVQTCLSSMDVDCEQSLTTLERNLSQTMPTRKERHCLPSPSGSEERDFKQTLTRRKQKGSLQSSLSGKGTQDNTKSKESLGEPRVCLTGQTDRQPESSMKNEDITPRIHTPEKQKKGRALPSDCKTASQQAESSWSTKESENSLASIHTPDKQKQGEGALTRDDKNAAYTESSGKSGLSKSDISRSRSVVSPNTRGNLVTDSLPRISVSSDQQTNLNYPTEQDLAKIKIESDLRITNICVQPLQHTATCINCVAASLSQDEDYAIKKKVNNDCNSKFDSSQEESTVAVISSDYVSSSQMDVVTIQPLKGLHVTTEEHCLSSSETSQSKTNSDESYSVLQGRSSLAEKSQDVSIVPSSENSEEFEFEQPLPNVVTPGRTAKRIHCSLSESQLENLFEASISFDDVTTPSCFEDAPVAKHKGDPLNKQRECSLCTEKLENKKSSSDVSSVQNIADNQPCVLSGQDLARQKSVHENESKEENVTVMDKSLKDLEDHEKSVINRTPIKTTTTDFDVLFSQNTWSFSQSSDLIEIDRRTSVKRKRSVMDESHVHFICASDETKQANEAQLMDSPVSPDSTSQSVKSSRHSGSSQSQLSNHSPGIYLAKPVDLYSQQDPLILDTSAESIESTNGVIDNNSGLLITPSREDDVQEDETSPSILDRSMEEPCTLSTPTFSLPSYQVPACKRATPSDVTSPKHDEQCNVKLLSSATWRQEAETCKEPCTNKKKRKPRRRKFNWFSDAY